MRAIATLLIFALMNFASLRESERLKKRIQILNLLVGLELNQDQIHTLERLIQRKLKLQQQKEKELAFYLQDYRRVLEEIEKQLLLTGKIEEKTKLEYQKIRSVLERERIKFIREETSLAKEFLAILQPHQTAALENYVPCIIPPEKGLRVGQASDYRRSIKMLERIRTIPPRRWNFVKYKIAERLLNINPRIRERVIPEKEMKEVKEKLLEKLEEARGLPEEEFLLKKQQLAEDIHKLLKGSKKRINLAFTVRKFLLNEEALELLSRLQKSEGLSF